MKWHVDDLLLHQVNVCIKGTNHVFKMFLLFANLNVYSLICKHISHFTLNDESVKGTNRILPCPVHFIYLSEVVMNISVISYRVPVHCETCLSIHAFNKLAKQ
jgi:hypothetical protein